jgi:hypothetical protein
MRSIVLTVLFLIAACSNALMAQTDAIPRSQSPWADLRGLGEGEHPSVAIFNTNLIVEVHSNFGKLYYKLGKLDPARGLVAWAQEREFLADRIDSPSIAVTNEGYVLISYTVRPQLKYYVGTVDPGGDINQEINFKVSAEYYDTGTSPGISINNNGIIVEVHQEDSDEHKLNYKIGHLASPATDDFHIVWDTGPYSIPYTHGDFPSISLNDNNDLVELHNVSNEFLIHYIRGHVSGKSIAFASDQPRYDWFGIFSSVALQDDGYVSSLHIRPGLPRETVYRLSREDPEDPIKLIHLSDSVIANSIKEDNRCAVASNGSYMIAIVSDYNELRYSWAIAP